MAKQAPSAQTSPDAQPKRKGVHAKRGSAKLKSSKNYKKAYRGQGRRR